MDNEIHDKTKMLTGDMRPRLTQMQREKLGAAYMELFIGLSGANWARENKTLGAAWYEALSQIKAMLGARDKNNPATEYLLQTFAVHNIQISRETMTNPNKDTPLELPEDKRAEWIKNTNKRVGDAMKIINEMTAKFKAPQQQSAQQNPTSQQGQKFDDARQKLLQHQQIILKIITTQNQNSAHAA